MRSLLDHNVPFLLTRSLPGHDVTHASQLGWQELSNGKLLAAAETAGFGILITADQNIEYQQNLTGRRLAMIVLDTNHWPTIRSNIGAIEAALSEITAFSYIRVTFERRPLRRRGYKTGGA